MTSTVTKNVFESLAAAIHDFDWDAAVDLGQDVVFTARQQAALRKNVALATATALVPANERFDPVRFVRACGVRSDTLSDQGIAAYATVLRLRINALSRSGR